MLRAAEGREAKLPDLASMDLNRMRSQLLEKDFQIIWIRGRLRPQRGSRRLCRAAGFLGRNRGLDWHPVR